MKYIQPVIIGLAFCLSNSACSYNSHKTFAAEKFKNDGQSIDSLKTVFKCESISLEKWASSEVTDSTFSICFINAGVLPGPGFEQSAEQIKEIARTVRASLKEPEKYNSYQVVFVEQINSVIGMQQSHRAGGVIRTKELLAVHGRQFCVPLCG